jgi:FAD/FMN-containing dehydrogenase
MTPGRELVSWGRVKRGPHRMLRLPTRHAPFPVFDSGMASALAIGNGRSYGDCGLNVGQGAIPMRGLDRFIAFDAASGLLRCEAGVLLGEILRLAVPQGWFLNATPGTRFVTVGGAIANDVHGKNHHRAGNFGCHVSQFELLRSDGERRICSATENPEWFAATIGGLGLTGIITWAELRLRRIDGPLLATESLRFNSLDEFMALSEESDAAHEYTVAWIDCTTGGRGRGIFSRANHSSESRQVAPQKNLKMPFTPPFSLVNGLSVSAFNALYFHRHPAQARQAIQHYAPFFYPLDGVLEWNRIYGPQGFHQYQCVIPAACGAAPIAEMLQEIGGSGSFLAVLKRFGTPASPGLLSFPQPGLTLALDFPESGPPVHALFVRLDAIVAAAEGRLYPAKDSRMPASLFRSGYPQLEKFVAFKDPKLSSDFWKRIVEKS